MAQPNDYYSSYEHVEVVGDGDQLCAHFHDHEDLQVSPAGFGQTDAEAIADLAHCVRQELEAKHREEHERLKAIIPVFQEARDALPLIRDWQAQLAGVRPDLADRMDELGVPELWKARYAAILEAKGDA